MVFAVPRSAAVRLLICAQSTLLFLLRGAREQKGGIGSLRATKLRGLRHIAVSRAEICRAIHASPADPQGSDACTN